LGQVLIAPPLSAEFLVKEADVYAAVIKIGIRYPDPAPKSVDLFDNGVVRCELGYHFLAGDVLVQLGVVIDHYIVHVAGETGDQDYQLSFYSCLSTNDTN